MRTIFIALPCLAASPSFGQSAVLDAAARNLALLDQYYAHGKCGGYAQQAAFWAPDAINLSRPMNPAMIRVQLEDIHRTFPDYESRRLESKAIGDTVVALSRMSGTHRGVAETHRETFRSPRHALVALQPGRQDRLAPGEPR